MTAPGEQARSRSADRTRELAGAVALVAAAFTQAPRWVSADTKLDLLIDPGAFLSRALHLWEPLGNFGQLQNQAYGYLLPMGPFFLAGEAVGVPPWVTQRLWWCVVLLTAYTGVLVLARRMGIGTPGTRILAALAFALSPRTSTELGGISIELWPSALAPWLLIPLVGVVRGRESRAAARSALVVALAGGVNAVAVGAMLPLGALWLAALPPGPVRRRLAAWWAVLVPLAMLWWLGPLLLLGRYSPPFLDWIESAAVTTSVATPANALRGVSHWVGWLGGDLLTWPGGYLIATSEILALLTWLVVALGLIGLGARSMPQRSFLIVALITGVALTTAGHVWALGPPWMAPLQHLLDTAGAPLRNTHKFDLVLRLPLALGLAHAVATFHLPNQDAVRRLRLGWTTHIVRWVAISGVIGLAVPAFAGSLMSRHPFVEIPPYWRAAAQWLADHDDGGRTLVLPGAAFATSTWGDPRDEPLQALASTAWGVRSVVPLSSAGNIRMLTVVEDQLATGRPSPGLADYLARAGVSRILLRADLTIQPGRTPTPLTVRSVLAGSPGFTSLTRFGPIVGATRFGDTVVDSGLDVAVPAIEIFQVEPAARRLTKPVELLDRAATLRVSGGPENLLTLADSGLLAGRAIALEGDPEAAVLRAASPSDRSSRSAPGSAVAPLVLTDGLQRREATFSSVRRVYSAPMTADQPWQQRRAVHDWYPFGLAADPEHEVVAEYSAISAVTGSSEVSAEHSAWAAIDADPTTFWRTDPLSASTAWLQLDFPEPKAMPATLTLLLAPGSAPTQVNVVTETGQALTEFPVAVASKPVLAKIPAGRTSWLRLEFRTSAPSAAGSVGVADLGLAGLAPTRTLRLPPAVVDPAGVVLRVDRSGSDSCVYLAGRPLCGSSLAAPSAEQDLNRELDLPGSASYTVTGWARPQPGAYLDDSLRPLGEAILVTASSRRSGEPVERPQASADGSLGTAWVAASDDRQPSVTLSWPRRQTLGAVQFQTDAALAVSRATQVRVEIGRRTVVVPVGADGWIRFPPTAADRITLTVTQVAAQRSLQPDGQTVTLPFGVSEIVLPGLERYRRGPVESLPSGTPCGFGPELVVAGRSVPTRVDGTVGDLMRRRPMRVAACPSTALSLPAGTSSVALRATFQWQPESLQLVRAGGLLAKQSERSVPSRQSEQFTAPVPLPEPTVVSWDAEQRSVWLPAAATERILLVHENYNAGWVATLAGARLEPVRVDGWQQGWLVPRDAVGEMKLRYTPGFWYRLWLVLGLIALVGVAVVARGRNSVDSFSPLPRGSSRLLAIAGAIAAVFAGGPVAALGLGLGLVAATRGRRHWGRLYVATVGAAALLAGTHVRPTDRSAWSAAASAAAVFMIGVLAAGLIQGRRRVSPDPSAPSPLDRTLDSVPRGRPHQESGAEREGQQGPEVTGEGLDPSPFP